MQFTLKPIGRSTSAHSSEITQKAARRSRARKAADEVRKVLGRADRIGEDDALWPARKERMLDPRVSDVAACRDEVLHPRLQRGIRNALAAVLLEERGEQIPFLLAGSGVWASSPSMILRLRRSRRVELAGQPRFAPRASQAQSAVNAIRRRDSGSLPCVCAGTRRSASFQKQVLAGVSRGPREQSTMRALHCVPHLKRSRCQTAGSAACTREEFRHRPPPASQRDTECPEPRQRSGREDVLRTEGRPGPSSARWSQNAARRIRSARPPSTARRG